MKIQDAAELTGLSEKAIRFYESIGFIAPKRRANNYRIFSDGDIVRLKVIRDLRQLGFTTREIHTFVTTPDAQVLKDMLATKGIILTRLRVYVATKGFTS